MAIITSIKRNYNKPTTRPQVKVSADFFVVDDNYVQIQTYSSDKSKTKSRSQTIKLARDAAKDLANLINSAFKS